MNDLTKKRSRFHQEFFREGTRRHDKLTRRVLKQESEIMVPIIKRLVNTEKLVEKNRVIRKSSHTGRNAYVCLRIRFGSSWHHVLQNGLVFFQDYSLGRKLTKNLDGQLDRIIYTLDKAKGDYYNLQSNVSMKQKDSKILDLITAAIKFVFRRETDFDFLEKVLTKESELKPFEMILEEACLSGSFVIGHPDVKFYFHKGYHISWDMDSQNPVIIEVKPEFKDYGSIIRQIKEYVRLEEAQLGVVVTYTSVSDEDQKLFFDSQDLLLITLEEKDPEPIIQQATLPG